MASYKEGNERMNQTGGGMDGPELSTLQEWVTKNVCRYYFELDSVLKDRPNVRAWYTNEDKESSNVCTIVETDNNISIDDSDDDDMIEAGGIVDLSTDTMDTPRKGSDDDSDDEYEDNRNTSINLMSNNIDQFSLSSPTEDNDSFNLKPIENSSDECTSSSAKVSKKKRKERQPFVRKLTPIEAKGIQRNMMKKKKSIARRSVSMLSPKVFTMDNEDRDLIKETALAKMTFDNQRHTDLKNIESEKLRIESDRLEMERSTLHMRKEQISAQTCLEKSRIVLLKLEMFKTREGIKKEYPNVTDEYLNTHFAYPE